MSSEKKQSDTDISKVFADSENLTKTLQLGINAALMQHKWAGNSVCEWVEDRVVWVKPENIPDKPRKKTDV